MAENRNDDDFGWGDPQSGLATAEQRKEDFAPQDQEATERMPGKHVTEDGIAPEKEAELTQEQQQARSREELQSKEPERESGPVKADEHDALGEGDKAKDAPQFDFNQALGQLQSAQSVAKSNGMPHGSIDAAIQAIQMVQQPGGSTMSPDQVMAYVSKAQNEVKDAEAKEVQQLQEAVGTGVAIAVAAGTASSVMMESAGTGAALMAEMITGESSAPDENKTEQQQQREKNWSESAIAVLASVGIKQGELQTVAENLGAAMKGYSNGLDQLKQSIAERGEEVANANINAPGRDIEALGELPPLEALAANITKGPEAGIDVGRTA